MQLTFSLGEGGNRPGPTLHHHCCCSRQSCPTAQQQRQQQSSRGYHHTCIAALPHEPIDGPRALHCTAAAVVRYTEFTGFHGIIGALLVSVKQIMPDHEVKLFGAIQLKARVSSGWRQHPGSNLCSSLPQFDCILGRLGFLLECPVSADTGEAANSPLVSVFSQTDMRLAPCVTPLTPCPVQYFPSVYVLVYGGLVMATLRGTGGPFLVFLLLGTYISWVYLRFFQQQPDTALRGEESG